MTKLRASVFTGCHLTADQRSSTLTDSPCAVHPWRIDSVYLQLVKESLNEVQVAFRPEVRVQRWTHCTESQLMVFSDIDQTLVRGR